MPPEIAVTGQPVSASAERGFATLNRAWRAGDRVCLKFPMTVAVRTWIDRNTAERKRISVSHGPLLFALGIAGKDDNTPLRAPVEPLLPADLAASSISVERCAMPAVWDWPLDAPVKLHLVDAAGEPRTLVPYGCTKMRISAFPVAETPARLP